ncbi:MAG: 16S rRNA (cytidine(1402)-2'-O)-methyltransferase [Actinomycetota bacterium]
MSGRLIVVATPIGNLDDLSPRAVSALRSARRIACEDTRVTRKLLTRAPTDAKLVAYHAHSPRSVTERLLKAIEAGETVVLVTDAGMPGVSDPGQGLIDQARSHDLRVEVIPGPSAALTALVSSGLPTARFCVEGFLPQTGKARRRRLAKLADEDRTMVFFEAPHRVRSMLEDARDAFGEDRRVALCRELTKVHEEVVRSTIAGLLELLSEPPKGECTLVIEGRGDAVIAEPDDEQIKNAVLERIGEGASTRDAVAGVVAATGVAKRRVYDLARDLKGQGPGSR